MNLPSFFNSAVFSTPINGRVKSLDICSGIPVSLLPNAVLSNCEKSKIKLAAENLAQTLPKIDARINSTGRKDVNKGLMVFDFVIFVKSIFRLGVFRVFYRCPKTIRIERIKSIGIRRFTDDSMHRGEPGNR